MTFIDALRTLKPLRGVEIEATPRGDVILRSRVYLSPMAAVNRLAQEYGYAVAGYGRDLEREVEYYLILTKVRV